MKTFHLLLLLGFVSVQSRSAIPEPPTIRIGPFDWIGNYLFL